jgi:hypothetical protein
MSKVNIENYIMNYKTKYKEGFTNNEIINLCNILNISKNLFFNELKNNYKDNSYIIINNNIIVSFYIIINVLNNILCNNNYFEIFTKKLYY